MMGDVCSAAAALDPKCIHGKCTLETEPRFHGEPQDEYLARTPEHPNYMIEQKLLKPFLQN